MQPNDRIGILVQLAKFPVVTQHRSQLLKTKKSEHRSTVEWKLQSRATQAIAATFRRSGYQTVILNPDKYDPAKLSEMIVKGKSGWKVSEDSKSSFANLKINLQLAGLVIVREAIVIWSECVPVGVVNYCRRYPLESGLFSQISPLTAHWAVPGYRFRAYSFDPLGDVQEVDHLALIRTGQIDSVTPEGYRAPDDPKLMTLKYFEPVIATIIANLKLLSKEIASEFRLAPGERAVRDGTL